MDQFKEFDAGFANAVTSTWEEMVLVWESDNTKADPYLITTSCKSIFIVWGNMLTVHNSKDSDSDST
jgi:hypothetical protein